MLWSRGIIIILCADLPYYINIYDLYYYSTSHLSLTRVISSGRMKIQTVTGKNTLCVCMAAIIISCFLVYIFSVIYGFAF